MEKNLIEHDDMKPRRGETQENFKYLHVEIWWPRRMLSSLRHAFCLDSTHICLNNPENHQKTSRTDSLETRIDKRPTEEGRKGREAVHTTRTGGTELGRWRGSPPGKAEPPSLACKSGGARRSVFSQPAGLNTRNVVSQQLCSESGRARGRWEGEVLSPGRQSSAQRGTKALASAISLSHSPAEIPKGTSYHHRSCLHGANSQCCASVDPSLLRVCLLPGATGPLPQGTTYDKAS